MVSNVLQCYKLEKWLKWFRICLSISTRAAATEREDNERRAAEAEARASRAAGGGAGGAAAAAAAAGGRLPGRRCRRVIVGHSMGGFVIQKLLEGKQNLDNQLEEWVQRQK